MEDVFVGSLMSSPVETVGTETPLRDAGRVMLEKDIGSVIVIDGEDQLEGILTATDFTRAVATGELRPDTTVGTTMSTDVITTTAREPVRSVADRMIEHGFDHFPVVDDGTVIGVITSTDLAAYLSTKVEPSPVSPTK